MGFSVAVRAFFAALARKDASERIEAALRGVEAASDASKLTREGSETPASAEEPKTGAKSKIDARAQPSALALLAALQREARFVDFVKEPLESFDDATIGAAARGPLGRCAAVLERFFEIRPLTDAEEGGEISLNADAVKNSARVQFSGGGNGTQNGWDGETVVGRLAHSGWIAKKCATPSWSGSAEDAFVLAPIEIDVESTSVRDDADGS